MGRLGRRVVVGRQVGVECNVSTVGVGDVRVVIERADWVGRDMRDSEQHGYTAY